MRACGSGYNAYGGLAKWAQFQDIFQVYYIAGP
jgi:hypothetical protein